MSRARSIAGLAGGLVAVAVAVVLQASAAAAQSVSHSSENASGVSSDVGGLVFLGVSAVIAGGALILYLRHRTPRAAREAKGTGEAR